MTKQVPNEVILKHYHASAFLMDYVLQKAADTDPRVAREAKKVWAQFEDAKTVKAKVEPESTTKQ